MEMGDNSSAQQSLMFINLNSNRHSRTRNYFNGLKRLEADCRWIDVEGFMGLKLKRVEIEEFARRGGRFIITSPSHTLVLYFVFLFHRRPILDAGWPLYDGVISSRREYGFLGFNLLKTLLVDFLSFHLSSKVLVESEKQRSSISRKYLLRKKRLCVLLTGFDELRFNRNGVGGSEKEVVVLFRGGAQEEAGLAVLQKCAQSLEALVSLKFKLITNKLGSKFSFGPNVDVIDEYMDDEYLYKAFRDADLVLGQLSDHERLNRTNPHKFFEAAFMGKPYLSADKGLMQGFKELGIIYTFKAGDSLDLADAIRKIVAQPEEAKLVGSRLKDWYLNNASQVVLSRKLLEFVYKK